MESERLTGRELLGYRLARLVGSGSTSAVYLGEGPNVRAVKVVHPHVAALPDLARHLAAECEAWSAVDDPNVQRVYTVERFGQFLVLVCESLDGIALPERYRSEPPADWRTLVKWFRDACSGLAAVHSAGLVYGCISPKRLFVVDRSASATILDGCITRALKRAGGWTCVERTRAQSRRQPPAPREVLSGEPWTARSDVFALGTCLDQAFDELFPARRGAGAAPAPTLLRRSRSGVPARLAQIVRQATAGDPAVRFETAAEMRAALSGLLAAPNKEGKHIRIGRTARIVGACSGAAVVVAGVAVLGTTLKTQSGTPDPPVRRSPPVKAPAESCPSGMVMIPGTRKIPSFCMDRTEVSVREYAECVGRSLGPCTVPASVGACTWDAKAGAEAGGRANVCSWEDAGAPLDTHPANCVTHDQASQFCRAMRQGSLPTLEQWHVAAAGPDSKRRHAWAVDADPSGRLLNARGAEWDAGRHLYGDSDGCRATAPVEAFDAGRSPEGVLQLAGNVWEWLAENSAQTKCAAGGSYTTVLAELVETAKLSQNKLLCEHELRPNKFDETIGFRCVRRPDVASR